MRVSDRVKRANSILGIAMPVKKADVVGMFATTNTTIAKLKSNLYVAILTGIGTRVMNPDFGTIIPNMMFEQIDDRHYSNMESHIKEAVAKYTPQLNLDSVSIVNQEENEKNNKIEVSIDISLVRDPAITEN